MPSYSIKIIITTGNKKSYVIKKIKNKQNKKKINKSRAREGGNILQICESWLGTRYC